MADDKKPPASANSDQTQPAATVALSAEDQAKARVRDVEREIAATNADITKLRGKLLNLDPMLISRMEKKRKELRARINSMEKALFGLLLDGEKPRTPDEERIKNDLVRLSALEYFKKITIDPHLWKSLEY